MQDREAGNQTVEEKASNNGSCGLKETKKSTPDVAGEERSDLFRKNNPQRRLVN